MFGNSSGKKRTRADSTSSRPFAIASTNVSVIPDVKGLSRPIYAVFASAGFPAKRGFSQPSKSIIQMARTNPEASTGTSAR
jgi:hypothetical protein